MIWKKFKKKNEFKKNSYSQSGEDLVIDFVFRAMKLKNPSYLDIGAFHPYKFNNTAIFYNSGSRGINIEPNPEGFQEFRKSRGDDINLNVGIGAKEGSLTYYMLSASTLNTFSKESVEEVTKNSKYRVVNQKEIKIITVDQVMEQYSPEGTPDFLSLDVEGMDKEILESIDFKRHSFKVLCLETLGFGVKGTSKKDPENIIKYIQGQGYKVYADTYLNTIFIRDHINI